MELTVIKLTHGDIFWLSFISITILATMLWSLIVYFLSTNDLIDSHYLFTMESIVIIYAVFLVSMAFSTIMFFLTTENSIEKIKYFIGF